MKPCMWLILVTIAASSISSRGNQSNKCDIRRTNVAKTDCTNCRANIKAKCPLGYRKTTSGRGRRGCRYRLPGRGRRSRVVRGCQHKCLAVRTEPRCCEGFWGQDCQECPKLNMYVCGGKGICFDGIKGNGTCKCNGNVAGSACEKCAVPNQFGSYCENNCTCVHGLCDSGVDRPGRCECESGFGGASCDIALSDCATMNCHEHARCLGSATALTCQCNPGYIGNGTDCKEINPCTDNSTNRCHTFAQCVHKGPAMYDCNCRDGYSGDGRYCSPIDPCQNNNGGCSSYSTVCNYRSPGKAYCACKNGYSNLTASGCTLINICNLYPNSTCDPRASCTTTDENQIISVRCECPLGSIAKGLNCYSDLLTEIINSNNKTGPFQNQLGKAISMFSLTFFHELSFVGLYTVLVPLDSAFDAELGDPDDNVLWKTRARTHIVAGAVEVDFSQQTANSMFPLLGYNASLKALRPTQDVGAQPQSFAILKFNQMMIGNILEPGNWASNGLFYITDTFLKPPRFPLNYDARNMTFLQCLRAIPEASRFIALLKTSLVWRRWIKQARFTLFVPTNDAIASLSAEELKFFNSLEGLNSLQLLMLEHMSPNQVNVKDLIFDARIETTHGALAVNVLENGVMEIGRQQAKKSSILFSAAGSWQDFIVYKPQQLDSLFQSNKILISEIPIKGESYVYLLDKLLIPESILPIVKKVCQDVTVVNEYGPCGDCGRTERRCSPGDELTDPAEAEGCIYIATSGDNSLGQRLGCRYMCKSNSTTDVCCNGFFGPDCWSCPGPTHRPCNDNGICVDGKEGNGKCQCEDVFAGLDCSKCNSTSLFGKDCNQNCTCVHGICDASISSRGVCLDGTCSPGWSGENCDRRVYQCGPESIICDQHATCSSNVSANSNGGFERCECDPGYLKSDAVCVEFNQCVDSDDAGGCDVNAECWYLGKGNYSCHCSEFYTGDGITCDPINPCQFDYTGCHDNAECMFSGPGQMECACRHGYRGNGYICEEINICLENNGGCHYRAKCQPTTPGERTCACVDGYQGDGIQCVGYLLMEVYEHPQLTFIKHWVDTIPSVRDLFVSVQFSHLTAFLPRDGAWKTLNLDDFHFWANEAHLPFLLRHHLVEGLISSRSLKSTRQLTSMLPSAPIVVTNVTDETIVTDVQNNLTTSHFIPTLGPKFVKITQPDIAIFNGIVHILDDVLLPPRDVVEDHPYLKDAIRNSTGTKLAQYSVFLSYLNSTGVMSTLEEAAEPYTIFVLSNDLLNTAEIDRNNKATLQFKYHVIPGKMIRLKFTKSGQHETTMAGSGYQVTFVRRHTQYLVNNQEIIDPDIRTQRGILHGLRSELLVPVKRNCDQKVVQFQMQECKPCSSYMSCPLGALRLSKISCRQRILPTGPLLNPSGCKLLCLSKQTIPRCCPGFYGPGCEPCQGGVGNVCFSHGTCFDGIKGNGSCNCGDARFSGPACDECASNLFGSDCHVKCNCVHGVCLDGISGTGQCICNKGFWGKLCDKVKDPNDSCGGSCNSSSVCVSGICRCDVGYSGTDTCTPINPCDLYGSSHCHAYAACKYEGPGLHSCKCKDGYQGDGTYCSEMNPCLQMTKDSPCDSNADCIHIGPNQSNCLCRGGYTGDGKTCEPTNACDTKNGGCHVFARCTKTGPGTRYCTCFDNYVGDGVQNCTGTMYDELIGVHGYSALLGSGEDQISRRVLSSALPKTLFLPPSNSDVFTKYTSFLERQWSLLSHIVGCESLSMDRMKSLTDVRSMVGSTIHLSSSNSGSILLNSNISVKERKETSNGMIYFINGSLNVPSQMRIMSDSLTNTEDIIKSYGSKQFFQYLNSTGDVSMLTSLVHESWTLFIPTDEAYQKLSSYKKRQLRTDSKVAQEYLRYHMVRQSMLLPSDVSSLRELTTMQGSSLSVECSKTVVGQLTVNQKASVSAFYWIETVLIMQQLIPTSIFIIDTVLEPPSVGGRCDVVVNTTVEGTCSLCVNNQAMNCPSGMIRIGQRTATCDVRVSTQIGSVFPTQPLSGCAPLCSVYNVTKKCCPDHFGRDCHPCPGLPGKVCSGFGDCDEGIDGTGVCACHPGYRGFACERCKQQRYGRSCEPCICSTHGHCSDGMTGSGYCFCDEGWTGQTCDKRIAHPSLCNSSCTEHAICLDNGQCVCEYGYVGNGLYMCEILDLCAENPCSIHATCNTLNHSVSCQCNFPYAGDGYVCVGYDPCQDPNSSVHCHELARCVYVGPNVTRCDCPPGYHGDGKEACEYNFEASRPAKCALNNGECSLNAACADFPNAHPPRVNCTCKPGYVGDGYVCNGNLYQVFKEGLYNIGKFYQKGLRRNINYMIKLRQSKKMTLFVPRNEALRQRRMSYRTLIRHIASGVVYTSSDLRNSSLVLLDSRTAMPIKTTSDGKIFINDAEIVTSDIPATNGIIHIINDVISRKIVDVTVSTRVGEHVTLAGEVTSGTSSILAIETTTSSTTASKVATSGTKTGVTSQAIALTSTIKNIPQNRGSSSGAKVGIAVGVVGLLLVVVGVLYCWKRQRGMFVFRPLSDRSLSSRHDDLYSEIPASAGMENPSYVSTAFREPQDNEGLFSTTSSPVDGDEEHEALVAFKAD